MGPGPWLVLAESLLCWDAHTVPLTASVGPDPTPPLSMFLDLGTTGMKNEALK